MRGSEVASRPSRAKMCNWLEGALLNLIPISPYNPATIAELSSRAGQADLKLRAVARIASELGWHADASLDLAYELIQAYEKEFNHDNQI